MTFVPKIIAEVIKPIIKLEQGKPVYVKILSPIVLGKEIAATKGGEKQKPAHLMDVTNLETGENGQIVVSAVLRGAFQDNFADASYVGRCFAIVKLSKREGKDYNDFKLAEIEDPAKAGKAAPKK